MKLDGQLVCLSQQTRILNWTLVGASTFGYREAGGMQHLCEYFKITLVSLEATHFREWNVGKTDGKMKRDTDSANFTYHPMGLNQEKGFWGTDSPGVCHNQGVIQNSHRMSSEPVEAGIITPTKHCFLTKNEVGKLQ